MQTSDMILAQGGGAGGSGVTADSSWDLETFFNNATDYSQTIGGALLALAGLIAVIWGGVMLVRKLVGDEQKNRDSWIKIALCIIMGGAVMFGGMRLLLNFAHGGADTIENFGNGGGMIVTQNVVDTAFASGLL